MRQRFPFPVIAKITHTATQITGKDRVKKDSIIPFPKQMQKIDAQASQPDTFDVSVYFK
jgi:hypothetical protein